MKHILISVGLTLAMSFGVGVKSRADEVRLGLMVHDVEGFQHLGIAGVHGKEQSLSVSADYVWDKPDWLDWALHARPYIGGTLNLEGKTSHAGAGVLWRQGFWDKTYGELAFGMVIHDGKIRVPNPIDAATRDEIERRFALKRSKIEFGSRVLFRTQFAIGHEFSDKWAGELVYEHLSHGQILGGPENEGSNNLGIRIARRF